MSDYIKDLASSINGFTKYLDINSLAPYNENFFGIRDIDALAESIKEHGLLSNLVVRKSDKEGIYEILAGERRYTALKQLGHSKIPCKVVVLSDVDARILMIESNVNQRELTPLELMKSITELEELHALKKKNGEKLPAGKKTRDLIGTLLGRSGSQIGKLQSIKNNVIGDFIILYDKGDITQETAMTLGSLNSIEQASVYEGIKDLSSKDLKDEIAILINGIKQPVESKEDKELLEEMFALDETETLTETIDNINILPGQIEQQIPELHEENSVVSEEKESAAEIVLEGQSVALGEDETKVEPIDNGNLTVSPPELKPDLMNRNLEKMLDYDPFPKLVLNTMGVESILFISNIEIEKINYLDYKLQITLPGNRDNIIKVPLSKFQKVDRLPNSIELEPQAYKVHSGVYLWFKDEVSE